MLYGSAAAITAETSKVARGSTLTSPWRGGGYLRRPCRHGPCRLRRRRWDYHRRASAQAIEDLAQVAAHALQLIAVRGDQRLEQLGAARRQAHEHMAAIGAAGLADQQPLGDHAVDQPDGAVMADLQALGELADRRPVAPGEAAHREQRALLLRRDAGAAPRLFAEVQEAPQGVAELRQSLVLLAAHPRWPWKVMRPAPAHDGWRRF